MGKTNLLSGLFTRFLSSRIGSRKLVFILLGFILLLLFWAGVARFTSSIVISGPVETFRALWNMLGTSPFHADFWITLKRVLVGIFFGGLIGLGLGLLAGRYEDIRYLLEPLRWTAMSVPPVIVLVLAMLWLGLGTKMVVWMAAFLLAPIIYVNTVEGMALVDRKLLQMATLYRFSPLIRIRHVYLPALSAPLSAGMIQVLCSGVRVVILAEVMGAGEGIGSAIATASSNLEIPTLFAWVVLSIGLVAVIEYGLLRPVQSYLLRWNRA